MRGKNNLTRQQFFSLGVWLGRKAEPFKKASSSPEEVLRQTKTDLGFDVTEKNLRSAIRDIKAFE